MTTYKVLSVRSTSCIPPRWRRYRRRRVRFISELWLRVRSRYTTFAYYFRRRVGRRDPLATLHFVHFRFRERQQNEIVEAVWMIKIFEKLIIWNIFQNKQRRSKRCGQLEVFILASGKSSLCDIVMCQSLMSLTLYTAYYTEYARLILEASTEGAGSVCKYVLERGLLIGYTMSPTS